MFYIEVYKWDEEWKTWLQVSREASITDTEENAIKISTEKLHSFSVDDTDFE
ncbi:hypothetical protein [Caloramator sp. E03]|uniref:hypothetical protein n=1 Tax=Caloramator sp. E03 TaxID=2576307 RepID=UPI00143D4FB6|nr:hypothetical protein [Caloramator sp. E03]